MFFPRLPAKHPFLCTYSIWAVLCCVCLFVCLWGFLQIISILGLADLNTASAQWALIVAEVQVINISFQIRIYCLEAHTSLNTVVASFSHLVWVICFFPIKYKVIKSDMVARVLLNDYLEGVQPGNSGLHSCNPRLYCHWFNSALHIFLKLYTTMKKSGHLWAMSKIHI